MPSPSCLSLSMHKYFCSSSLLEVPTFAYPPVSSSFSSKPLLSAPLSWLCQSQLYPSAFSPRSLLQYQSPNSLQALSVLTYLPSFLPRNLLNTSFPLGLPWPLWTCLSFRVFPATSSQAFSTLHPYTCIHLYLPMPTWSFCQPKSRVTCSSVQPWFTFLTSSLFLHHLHASLLFFILLPPIPSPSPCSSQAKLEHCRDKCREYF